MARAIKKVKVKKERTAKFYIIISAIVVAVIGGLIGLGLGLYVHFNTEDIENLFPEYTEYKINYDQMEDILNSEYKGIYSDYEETFIIVYDSSFKYDDDKDMVSDPTNVARAEALEQIKDLKDEIDAYNAIQDKPYTIAFFLIDSSLTTNSEITTVNGGSDDSTSYASPSLIHIYGDSYENTHTFKDVDYTIAGGNGSLSEFNNVLKEACNYVRLVRNSISE